VNPTLSGSTRRHPPGGPGHHQPGAGRLHARDRQSRSRCRRRSKT